MLRNYISYLKIVVNTKLGDRILKTVDGCVYWDSDWRNISVE
jgi:hypothetical protein